MTRPQHEWERNRLTQDAASRGGSVDDRNRWWDLNIDPERLRRVQEREKWEDWAKQQILGTFAIPKEALMGVKVSECSGCLKPVSEMANFVKIGMNKVMHTECYVRNVTGSLLSEQEKVLTESFIRREQELVNTINQLKQAKGETAVVSKSDTNTVIFDTKTWDEAAEKICKLAVAHIGPTLPLHTLKRYAWFIYTKLRDEKLIQPLKDDKPEETKNEAMERSKRELEEWLRSTTVKKEQ